MVAAHPSETSEETSILHGVVTSKVIIFSFVLYICIFTRDCCYNLEFCGLSVNPMWIIADWVIALLWFHILVAYVTVFIGSFISLSSAVKF